MVKHTGWFVEQGDLLTLNDIKVGIINFDHLKDEDILSSWATHFRNHYCKDEDIDDLRDGFGLSRSEYLKQIKFPESPSIISGDFSEILVADYLEYIQNYIIPRTRYLDKINKDTSPNGTDIIGFKLRNGDRSISPDDTLITCEVKGHLVTTRKDSIQNAVNHAKKDELRLAESLNAIRQKLRYLGESEKEQLVRRYQNRIDRPYKKITSAFVVHSHSTWEDELVCINEIDTNGVENLCIYSIKGDNLMDLARELYRRASNEA